MNNFDGLQYFTKESQLDHWGDPDKMQRSLLVELDKFRSRIGSAIYVTSGYRETSSGSTDSQHCKGLAADIVAPFYKGHLMDLYIEATRFAFVGIGIYRDWHYWDQNKSIGGLHVDTREGSSARWFCFKGGDGIQQYQPLTVANLKFYGVL